MSTFDGAITVLCVAGAIQGLMMATALLSVRDGDVAGHRLLAAIVAGGSAVALVIVATHRLSGPVVGWLELVETAMWLASGPVVFLYVRRVARIAPVRGLAWLHFAPAAAWTALALFEVLAQRGAALAQVRLPPVAALIAYQAAYTLASIVVWRTRPADARPGLHSFWVPALLATLALQHVAQVFRFLLRDRPAFDDVVPLSGALAFFVLTALGLRRALVEWNRRRERYAGSDLGEDREQEIAERVREVLERERAYLDPELSAAKLAERVGVPRTHLSQALNHRLGESFQDLIGRYRVAESERLLAEESLAHLTVEAIGRRSGFKSRSAFYAAFGRAHPVTPAEYRRVRAAAAEG